MEKKSFRIPTSPNDDNSYVMVNLDQSYDTLEILSLNISQSKVYKDFSSDYGVLVGRVLANGGFGIPNAKVSIFVPLTDEDSTNQEITNIYPYSTITDKSAAGVRYNLISPINFSAGTFPFKQQVLDNDSYLEVYKTYYKYTTVTNQSGDYMIFGIPVGQQIVHMDTDLSNIGSISFTADSMVANGINSSLFNKIGNNYQFKGGNYLDQLPQIISNSISVDIKALWGDTSTQQIGISRLDFNINVLPNPVAYLTFAYGYDPPHLADGYYNGTGPSPIVSDTYHLSTSTEGGLRPGFIGRLTNNPLQTIMAYEYDINGNQLPYDPLSFKDVSSVADIANGVCKILLPCNLNKVVTDDLGNLVLSGNENGIGTTGSWLIEVNSNGASAIINFLIQKNATSLEYPLDMQPFEVRAGRVYSVRTQMFNAYTLRDSGGHNILNSIHERPLFNPGDWLNGFLYFGYGGASITDFPGWLNDGGFYNVESTVLDVTDYLDVLTNPNIGLNNPNLFNYELYNFKSFLPTDFPSGLISQLENDNIVYGETNADYQPEIATSTGPNYTGGVNYVFLPGYWNKSIVSNGVDCFSSIKSYIGVQ